MLDDTLNHLKKIFSEVKLTDRIKLFKRSTDFEFAFIFHELNSAFSKGHISNISLVFNELERLKIPQEFYINIFLYYLYYLLYGNLLKLNFLDP